MARPIPSARAKWDQVESPFRSNHLSRRTILSENSATFQDRALGIGHEQAEWQEWTDRDVLVVHDMFRGQRKALHDRLRLGDIPGIQQEDGSATISTRVPFANLPLEIELHRLPDFSRHDGHDLVACDARLRCK